MPPVYCLIDELVVFQVPLSSYCKAICPLLSITTPLYRTTSFGLRLSITHPACGTVAVAVELIVITSLLNEAVIKLASVGCAPSTLFFPL